MCSCIAALLRRKDLSSQASANVFAAKRGTLQEHMVFKATEETQATPCGKRPAVSASLR